jgi:cysteine desulfurase
MIRVPASTCTSSYSSSRATTDRATLPRFAAGPDTSTRAAGRSVDGYHRAVMIYLDHAATTPVRREVLEAMLPGFTEHWGNPSSIYAAGRRARQALDEARETIAAAIGAEPREIVLTSGGTEADNLAVKGIAWAASARGRHIVTSAVEHHAVLHACQVLERSGFEVTYVGVDRWGRVDPDEVAAAIGEHTILVTIMTASNEVGTVQPVAEIGAICRERRVPFHTDAVQAAGSLPIDVDSLGVSLLSLAAHKIHGPKGIGALYVRRGTQLLAQHHGGSQERQRRAGTESVALAAGFARALALAVAEREAETARQAALRDRLIAGLTTIDDVELTGHPSERLANSASFVVGGVQGGDLVAALDMAGIAASTGSACTSGSVEPSHVLLAMGIAPERAQGSLRLTLGRDTTGDEIDRTIAVVAETVGRLRGTHAPQPAAASVS